VNSQGSAVQGRWSLPKCCSIWLIALSWISVRVLSSWQCRIAGGKDQAAVWRQQRRGTCCFVLALWLLLGSSASSCSKSTSANEMVFVIKWRERERESSVLIICLVIAKLGDHRPVAVWRWSSACEVSTPWSLHWYSLTNLFIVLSPYLMLESRELELNKQNVFCVHSFV